MAPLISVHYHKTGTDIQATGFVGTYHLPGIRTIVRDQLFGLKDSGVNILLTDVWLGLGVNDPSVQGYLLHFPPNAQEQANMLQYVQDVAEADLELEIVVGWLWCGDVESASDLTGDAEQVVDNDAYDAGHHARTWGEYVTDAQQSYADLVYYNGALAVTRPSGVKCITRLYLTHELDVVNKHNYAIWTPAIWPWLKSACENVSLFNIEPAVYMICPYYEATSYVGTDRVVPTANFLASNGGLPAQLRVSTYYEQSAGVMPPSSGYADAIDAWITAMESSVYSIGSWTRLHNAECPIPVDGTERVELMAALAARDEIASVSFWPAHGLPPEYTNAPPFDFYPLTGSKGLRGVTRKAVRPATG